MRAMIGADRASYCKCTHMWQALLLFYRSVERFERWFDLRFGWFFTNGMKGRNERRPFVH